MYRRPSFLQIISYWILSNHVESQNITHLSGAFADQLSSLMCDGLRIGGDKCSNGKFGIQDFIYSFDGHYADHTTDASELSQSTIDRLDEKLNQRAAFLLNLSQVIRSECALYIDDTNHDTHEILTDFDDLYFAGNEDQDANLPNDMEYSAVYGNTVSLSSSTYRLPYGVDRSNENIQRDAQLSQLLDTTMRNLYNEYCMESDGNDEYCMMYFGTINGLFRQFPGVENTKDTEGTYANYDPRFRPWYVSAATGSKDVVVLMDISGSMRSNNRIQLAKDAVISVLHTLGASSSVNVVAFSDTLTLSCFERELVAATSRNVAELVDFVDGLEPYGLTDFGIAFNAAFDILEGATYCQTVILFLTDGIAHDVSHVIEERNTEDIGAVIFSFTLGDDADASVPQKVANSAHGTYAHIDDEDENLITAMSSYYLYFAYGGTGAEGERNSITLSSPYLDFDTDVVMITMTMPVYINDTYFVGVLGTDIPLSFLSDAIGDITIGHKSYFFLMTQESELLLHPLIPNAFELLDDNEEYNAIFVQDVEPKEFISNVLQNMLKREEGAMSIEASVKLPAGDVVYNGYIHESAQLLYIYSGVGPSSLSIAIVIYSESGVEAPNVPAFGLESSPNVDCDTNTALESCVAPFNVFHRLDLMKKCNTSWLSTAHIVNANESSNSHLRYNAFYEGKLYTVQYPVYYLQSGLFEHQSHALHTDPTCESLHELHTLSNRLGAYDVDNLPFGGFRAEISANVLNSIFILTSLHEFWKPAFLRDDSLFVSMWFGHYIGLHISYPGKQFKSTYNNVLRPWYQRAISYPDLMVWTTPYRDANTHKLVISASTVVKAANGEYAFGVAGYDYEYGPFVDYWHSVMSDVCDQGHKAYCYLIDSSAFCLYYEGMENDVNDSDISRKFFGELEPTIMQSLLDRTFFVNDTNVNFQDDTIDVTYIVDESVHISEFASEATPFTYNSGTYTVHAIRQTNLFMIYIQNYHMTNTYPADCPHDDACRGVTTPGCIATASGTECVSSNIDVCIEPDTPVSADPDASEACSVINELGACVLTNVEESDMCATDLLGGKCGSQKGKKSVRWVIILVACAISAVVLICIICGELCHLHKISKYSQVSQNPPAPSAPSAPPYETETPFI